MTTKETTNAVVSDKEKWRDKGKETRIMKDVERRSRETVALNKWTECGKVD